MLNFETSYLLTAIVIILAGIGVAIMAYPGPKDVRRKPH